MLEIGVSLVVLGVAVYALIAFVPMPPGFVAVIVVMLVMCLIVYLTKRFRVNTTILCRRRAQAALRSCDDNRQDEQAYDDA